MSRLRQLQLSDLPDLMRLKESAGWNQTEEDWLRLLRLDPEGAWGIEVDSHIVASGTLLSYGGDLAWLGMVLTLPTHRRRGLARQILDHLMQLARQRQIGWVKLDGTEEGQPLYEQLGFRPETEIERWQHSSFPSGSLPDKPAEAVSEPVRPIDPEELASSSNSARALLALDLVAFRADRSPLFSQLIPAGASGQLSSGAFALGRPGSNAAFLGPAISPSPAEASLLLRWILRHLPHGPIFWDLLPENTAARDLAWALGFRPTRHLLRMSCQTNSGAPPLCADNALTYATAGFELG